MSKAFDKVDHTNLLGICTNTVLLPNSTTGSVHSYRDASKRLQFSELFPENCSDKQVSEQCAKANKLLGFVRRVSRYIQSTQTRRTLYLSIVRCLLGYATQVWSPQSIGLLKRVENMQRRYEIYISTFIFHTRVLHMECSSRRANSNFVNITKRLWTCTTLTTLERGEQSVLGATQRGLSYAHQHATSSNLDFLFCFLLRFLLIY